LVRDTKKEPFLRRTGREGEGKKVEREKRGRRERKGAQFDERKRVGGRGRKGKIVKCECGGRTCDCCYLLDQCIIVAGAVHEHHVSVCPVLGSEVQKVPCEELTGWRERRRTGEERGQRQ
jgi:hypothetical protein